MKVLVFGGAGFLGSYVVDELVDRGHDVTIFDLIKSPYVGKRVPTVIGDIMDVGAVRSAVTGHQIVYNFAGVADLNDSVDKPVETVALNVIGNLNILDASRQVDIDHFVYASSVYVFSHRGAFYGASKKSSELIVEQYGEQYNMDYTIVRYGSVYGERADSKNRIYRILREALLDKKITLQGDGSEEREYVHGRDAAKLSVDVIEDEKYRKQNVMLTGIERFRYSDLLSYVKEMLNNEVEIEILKEVYRGHYVLSPYSFSPTIGVKLVNNPSIDFGQGMLECVDHIFRELQEQGLIEGNSVPLEYSE